MDASHNVNQDDVELNQSPGIVDCEFDQQSAPVDGLRSGCSCGVEGGSMFVG